MAEPPALPAPGGNALAALADVYGNVTPNEIAINTGDTTTEGEMSFVDESFDPYPRNDPRVSMPGVLDYTLENHLVNSTTYIDGRTANLAIVNQGVDPVLASDLMNAQREALQSEANARHSEELVRQRNVWHSEARDHIANVEHQAATELHHKNLLLNEQAAHAVSVQKTAEIHMQSQEQRIQDLSTELQMTRNNVGLANQSYQQASSSLTEAYSQLHVYKKQVDLLTQQTMDMQKDADNQRKDFEREIGRLRQEQEQLMKQLKDGSLGGTPRPRMNYHPGTEPPNASHPSRAAGSGIHQVPAKVVISDDDADDERSITIPPGLPPGGPPGGGDDDDDPGDDRDDRGRRRGKKDKKEKKSFITRWDAVIAGMTSEPDVLWKQAYFHTAIKNFRPLSHDLAVYDRTPEGEPNRSYEFLMKAARDYLERKRLEKMSVR
eukprot:s6081_g1.t1